MKNSYNNSDPKNAIDSFVNDYLEKDNLALHGYCKKYPSLDGSFKEKIKVIKFIKEGFKDYTWSGKKLGEFIIVEEIGRGGMGIVFLAIQSSLSRFVALKILPYGVVFDTKSVKRFQKEAGIIARFNHPNIAPIYFSGEEEGIYYIAMGFIDGLSTNKIINLLKALPISISDMNVLAVKDIISKYPDSSKYNLKNKNIPDAISPSRDSAFFKKSYFEFIITICIEICDALIYSHRNNICHGDLKPSNIILTNNTIPIIVDFGLAQDMNTITTIQSREFAGTLAYASPEQIKTNKISEKSDIWSLGVTLYELLSLKHPFYSDKLSDTLNKILNYEPLPLRKHSRKISKELEAIVFKCIEKDPNKRYLSMQLLKEDLIDFLKNKPIKAKPIGKLKRTYKLMRRRPIVSFLSIVLIITLIISSMLMVNKKYYDYINNAEILYNNDNYMQSIEEYNKALNLLILIPFSSYQRKSLYSAIGETYRIAQKYDEAVTYYNKTLKIDAKDYDAIAGLGYTYYEQSLYNKAIEYYNKLTVLFPKDRYNYWYLGKIYANKGDFDKALKLFHKYLTFAPKDAETLGEICNIIAKKGLQKKNEITKYLRFNGFKQEEINSILLERDRLSSD